MTTPIFGLMSVPEEFTQIGHSLYLEGVVCLCAFCPPPAANVLSLTLLILLVGAASFCRASDITYNVNLQVGEATVTGTITTDGTIGVFNNDLGLGSLFLDWSLVLNDPTVVYVNGQPSTNCLGLPCTFDLIGPSNGNQVVDFLGADLSATATQLLFNFSGTDGGAFFFETDDSAAVCFETTTDCISYGFGAGESLYINPWFVSPLEPPQVDLQYRSLSGTQVIGTAAGSGSVIPEPSTLALLGTGIAILGSRGSWKKRQRGR